MIFNNLYNGIYELFSRTSKTNSSLKFTEFPNVLSLKLSYHNEISKLYVLHYSLQSKVGLRSHYQRF